jgi:hypothetical protein
MPTGVSLFVWLPEERAKWVEMRAKRDPRDPRHVRAMSADLDKAQAKGVELSHRCDRLQNCKRSHRCDNRRHRQQTVAVSWHVLGTKSVELA